MRLVKAPKIEVVQFSDAIKIDIDYRPEFLKVLIRLLVIALTMYLIIATWHLERVWDKVTGLLLAAGVITDLVRLFHKRELIEITQDHITLRRDSLFTRERTYSAGDIKNLTFQNSEDDEKTYIAFGDGNWQSVKFAFGIDQQDAWRILEAIGSIGGIGATDSADGFDRLKLTSLNLSK